MVIEIPGDVKEILDEPVFVHMGTVDPDGSPQLSIVWIELDGDIVKISSVEGRAKPRNLRRDPRCTLSFAPLADPYRNVVMRGRAVSFENAGMGLIDRLARKYLGSERYEWAKPGQVRVDIDIEIDSISG